MPHDIMHVMFEGVLQLEVHLMLKHFLQTEHYFTLDTLNARIQNLAYSRTEARTNHSLNRTFLVVGSYNSQVYI